MSLWIALVTVFPASAVAKTITASSKDTPIASAEEPLSLNLDEEKLQGFNFRNSYRKGGYYEDWALRSGTRVNVILTTGNSESLALGGMEKFLAKKQRVTNLLMAGASYARSNLVTDAEPTKTTARRLFARDKFFWEFHRQLYTYVGGGWLTNTPLGINHEISAFGGFGYNPLSTEHHSLSIETGYEYNFEDRLDQFANRDVNNAALGVLYTWNITEKSFLEHSTEIHMNAENYHDTELAAVTELVVEIIAPVSVTLGADLHWDNDPVVGFRKLDTTTTAGITFLF